MQCSSTTWGSYVSDTFDQPIILHTDSADDGNCQLCRWCVVPIFQGAVTSKYVQYATSPTRSVRTLLPALDVSAFAEISIQRQLLAKQSSCLWFQEPRSEWC